MTTLHTLQLPSPPSGTPGEDPSRRWVLPADAPYLKNLAALWAADPDLAARVEATEARASYLVEPSKAGPPTVVVPTDDGRVLYLHSKYEPVAEAARLIDAAAPDGTPGGASSGASGGASGGASAFYLHGLGLGYALELLFDRAGAEAIFCVIEADLLLLRTAFEARDLSRVLESGRVVFLTRGEKPELFVRLAKHASLFALGAVSVDHPPSVQRHGGFHASYKTWIDEFAAYCRTSLNTAVHNGRRTAENVAANLGWYVSAPGVGRLKGRHAGQPAVVVSAGPSLRKNKHLLRGLQGRAVIVAVQTTLQPLLDLGVEPQFVTSLDYHDICARFFEKLPATLRTELVAEPKATGLIFDMHPGPLTILGNDFAENLVRELALDKPRLPAGATVAHLAYYLAEHMGCDPIIFVGQDLGFSDGLCYAPGTSYEDVWRPELSPFCTVEMKQWEQIARDRRILRRVPDHEGRPMYTEERLFTYLQQFERDFARSKARIIDATEGGALKRGATAMTLADAADRFCRDPLPPAPDDHPGPAPARLAPARLAPCLASLALRREEACRIEAVARETLPLLEEARACLGEPDRLNRVIAQIDARRSRMDGLGRCYDLILQLAQATEYARFKSDRRLAASKASGVEKQRRQIERDVANVGGLIAAAGEFVQLLDDVAARLAARVPAARVPAERPAKEAA